MTYMLELLQKGFKVGIKNTLEMNGKIGHSATKPDTEEKQTVNLELIKCNYFKTH